MDLLRRYGVLAGALSALSLGCAIPKPGPDVDAFGRDLIHRFEISDSTAIANAIDMSAAESTAWTMVDDLRDTLAAFHRDSIALVGWNTFESPDDYRADLTYEVHGDGWGIVTVALRREQGTLKAVGIHFHRMAGSLASLNAFQWSGKSWRHYLVALLALLFCAIGVISAVIVARTPMPRRFAWALLALVGFSTFSIDWTTGQTIFKFVQVQLFSAGAVRPGLTGPWIVCFALPLGAVIALWKRHQFKTGQYPAAAPAPARSPATPPALRR